MINCPHCKRAGYEKLESPSGRMVDTPCTCAIGAAVQSPFIGPQPGTSHQLAELAIDAHSQAMRDAGKWQCGNCFGWHDSDESCPEIHEGGWTADNIGAIRVPEHVGESE